MTATAAEEVTAALEGFLREYYRGEAAALAERYPKERRSLRVEFGDLFTRSPALADDFLANPDRVGRYLDDALRRLDLPIDVDLADATVRVTDSASYLERSRVSELVADDLGTYVAVTGQIAQVTEITHRLHEAAFACQRCGTLAVIPQPRMGLQEPHECAGCERQGPWTIDIHESEVLDTRKLKLEEPPEDRTRSEGVSVPVFVEDDLCHHGGEHGLPDRAGERAVVLGVYRPNRSGLTGRNASAEFPGWIDARAIEFVDDDLNDIDVDTHRDAIEAFANGEHGDPVELCKRSVTPSLEITDGLDVVLEAAVAWLFNSYRIDPPGLDQVRGDLHMAVIGDPATGKSSVLTNLAKIAPKCEFRSGTGLSKVGLTAAAQQEEFAGTTEWTLRPGILPRANGGHCIIDEVDDVIDDQTKAIHDALEGEQLVKVDKAGITADLPTRTALLASGNPVHGRYDPHEPIPAQIDLDPALVSRMDVLLSLQDHVDEDRDRRVAAHFLDAYEELSAVEIAHRRGTDPPAPEAVDRPVPLDVFRAWVHHARETCFPRLTQAARERLEAFYVEVRSLNADPTDPVPATPRSLAAGIRLATAFARVELSDTVEARHAERAIAISKRVVGVNYDPASGTFDVNRVDTGKPRSQHERVKAIEAIIHRESPEYDDGVPVTRIVAVAERQGMDGDRVEHDIERMLIDGRLFQPSNGRIRCS